MQKEDMDKATGKLRKDGSGCGSEAEHLPVLHEVLGLVPSPQGGLVWKTEAAKDLRSSRKTLPLEILEGSKAADTLT